ncbi:MAG: alpha-N-arabinofuranosidase, partial [Lachnospiraceae bacterium]|nr:alpha-N-arabinofuranosidase [Lachnospiraceae bacterium]
IDNITDNTTVGFKYFELKGLKSISFDLRGYFHGNIEFRTSLDGDPIAVSPRFESSSKWERHTMDVSIPDGVYALYFTYKGDGNVRMKSFILND